MTTPFQTLLATEASAAVPRISTAQFLDASENRAVRELWTEPATNPTAYAGKRIAVIATDGVEEIELTTVLHFFKSRGAITHLIAPNKPVFPPRLGVQIPALRETHILTVHYIETAGWVAFDKKLDEVDGTAYEAFIIPGGSWNPEALRTEPQVALLLKNAVAAGKVVAAMGPGSCQMPRC